MLDEGDNLATRAAAATAGGIRCACDDPDCTVAVWFDAGSRAMRIQDKHGAEHLMYLDPNAIARIVGGLNWVMAEIMRRGTPWGAR